MFGKDENTKKITKKSLFPVCVGLQATEGLGGDMEIVYECL